MMENEEYGHLKRLHDSLSGPSVDIHTVAGVVRAMLGYELRKRAPEEEKRAAEEAKQAKAHEEARAEEERRSRRRDR